MKIRNDIENKPSVTEDKGSSKTLDNCFEILEQKILFIAPDGVSCRGLAMNLPLDDRIILKGCNSGPLRW